MMSFVLLLFKLFFKLARVGLSETIVLSNFRNVFFAFDLDL